VFFLLGVIAGLGVLAGEPLQVPLILCRVAFTPIRESRCEHATTT
jgi:hypothetical protein